MKRSLFLAALVACATAKADTVVWYTFDDLGDVGTKLEKLSTVSNVVNSGTYGATVYQMAGMTKNSNQSGATDFLYVTNGIPETFRVFDPVARASASSVDKAVRFASNGGPQAGAMLETATDSSFFSESFTVEALVRFPENLSDAAFGVLATQLRDNSTYAWKIHFNWHNQITCYFRNSEGSEVNTGAIALSSGTFKDGKWHHVAMTVAQGESSSTVKIYFDYGLRKTYSLDSRIQFPESAEGSVLQVGGTTLVGQLFMGEIGEFRYSSAALSVDKFLRPRTTRNRLDDDCVLYFDFEDDMTDDWSWFAAAPVVSSTKVVNKASPGFMDGTFSPGEVSGKGLLPKIDGSVPSNAMRMSASDGKLTANTHSFYNNYLDTSNRRTARHLYCLESECVSLADSNFTIEMFYKADGNVLNWTPIFRRQTQAVYIGVQNDVGSNGHSHFCAQVKSVASDGSQTNSVTITDAVQTNDGKWHHLALVRNGRSLELYRDGGSIGTGTLEYDSLLEESGNLMIAGGGGSVNTFNGWIDSVRVTLRALEPEEFLQKARLPGLSIIIR